MILAIDFDNVIADYTSVIKRIVEEDRNLTPGSLPTSKDWNFETWGLTLEEFKSYHTKFIKENYTIYMKPLPNALNIMDHLYNEGHIIKIITQRGSSDWFTPELRQQVVNSTIQWLIDNKIKYHEHYFVKNKEEIQADLYIDDSPDVLNALNNTGKNYIIFDYLYNRKNAGKRVKTWNQIKQMIQIMNQNDLLSQQKVLAAVA